MGLFDKLRNEFVDIIEWIDDSRRTLVWRFPRYQNEIKSGAQLIVRPGQVAVLVNRGQIADQFEPGHHTLTTQNMPILSTIMGWKYGFNSPFKAEVYFVSTRQVTELKWGTTNPIMLRDPEFGPIRLRAFGTYSIKAIDAKALLTELVGTDSAFEADEINELLRSIIITAVADLLGKSNMSAIDLAARYMQMSEDLRLLVRERIDDEYGLDIPQLNIVNISFPEAVEKALDIRSSMGLVGDVNKFQQYQAGVAMQSAAENQANGGAAAGIGLGMGMAMAQRFGQPAAAAPAAAAGAVPPPLAPATGPAWHVALNGQSFGPVTIDQLAQMVAGKQVVPATLVWTAGMGTWTPAGQTPGVQQLFGAAPPPLPPSM